MKLAAYIDPAAAIRDNGPKGGLVIAEIDLADLTDAQRKDLAACNVNRGADMFRLATIDDCAVVYSYDRGILDHDNLVAFLDGRAAKRAEEIQRKEIRDREYELDALAKIVAGELPYLGSCASAAARRIEAMPEYKALKAAKAAADAARESERKAAIEAKERAEASAKAEAARAMAEWIGAHGSARLRRCLAEGIKCAGLYRDERLAADRPGWQWDTEGTNDDAVNPPEEAFAMLDAARKTAPTAKLVLLKIDEETDPDTGDVVRDASESFAAVADFLGRGIIFGEMIERK